MAAAVSCHRLALDDDPERVAAGDESDDATTVELGRAGCNVEQLGRQRVRVALVDAEAEPTLGRVDAEDDDLS